MIDKKTPNKNYPLPHPQNIASQDVGRIATAISMIDKDLGNASESINNIYASVENLNEKSLKIPGSLVGAFDTELQNVSPRKYVVVNDKGNGFSTVEGGGGDGGKKGEVLVKKSDENFDTTWVDPRAILKKATTTKETISDIQLPNNGSIILKDSFEIDLPEDLPQRGLSPIQISEDVTADSFATYILKDEIEEAEEENDFASKTKFGRVKIGAGIDVEDGVISVSKIGIASKENFGIVKIGEGFDINDGVLSTQTYPHADHENYGIIKLSSDFSFADDGSLQLANKSEEIIYQAATQNIVNNGIIKIVPNCACYRAFVNNDSLFSFDFGDFKPIFDVAFDLEIISDGQYVVNFGSDVLWELPCAGVNFGTTIIRFKKIIGETKIRGSLRSVQTKPIKLLTPDSSTDINEDYICGHNGSSWNACSYLAVRGTNAYTEFYNPAGGIWYIDFMKSTYVEYLEYVSGNANLTAAYFYIEGSVDGKTWKRLLSRENEKPTTYILDAHGFFKHYRILCRGASISYFRWYGFDIDDEKYELKRVMPIMQTDSANGFKITSSGLKSGSLYNLTTDSISTWANFEERLNGEYWVKYELAEPESVDMIDLAARTGAESERMPTWFRVEASNDDLNWVTILERASLTRWYQGESHQFWINNQASYKFYRLLSLEQPTANFSLSRFRLFKKIDGTSPRGFVPILSSASQGGYEVKASSDSGGGHYPYYAFDGTTSTRWASAGTLGTGDWIQIKFPTETLCNAVWMASRNDQYYGQAPTAFKILGSLDGIIFDTLKTITDQIWTQGEQKVFDFYNPTAYLYYRIEIIAIQNAGKHSGLSIVNFGSQFRDYKREINTYRQLTPIMTANEQDGFKITASEIYSEAKTYNPYEAFNGVVSDLSSWKVKSQFGWIQVELPVADKANMLKMAGGFSEEEPDLFTLHGSNDGENYVELLNSGDLIWNHNETKEWNFENEKAYKFYKIEAVNTKSAYVGFSEIQLFEHISTREY